MNMEIIIEHAESGYPLTNEMISYLVTTITTSKSVCSWKNRSDGGYSTRCGCIAVLTTGPFCQHCSRAVLFIDE